MIRRPLARTVALVAALALLTACGSSSENAGSTPATAASTGSSAPAGSTAPETTATGASGTAGSEASSGSSDQSAADLVPAAIRATGQLRIGNSPVYPPMSFLPDGKDNDDARIGFDVDLANAIAAKLQLKPVFERQQYEQYLPSLATNRLDVVISAMQDLESRRDTATFVDYYFTGPQLFTTVTNADVRAPEDLCGKQVVVGVANTGDQDAVTALSAEKCSSNPITVTTATDNAAALVALKQNRAAANIRGAEAVSFLMNKQEPNTYVTVGDPLSKIPAGIAINKSNTELVAAVAAAMKELMADGTYQEIGKTWEISHLLLSAPMVNGKEL